MNLTASPHDAALRESVSPAGWENPVPGGRYNLVVVGGGTAGLVAAAGAAGLGAKVALVEERLMGGDCLNFGCVPSKALLRSARAVGEARAAARLGVTVTGAHADFQAVMERMRSLRAGIARNDSAARFRELGVEVFLGRGRFVGPDRLQVGGQTLEFARALIATGGRPVSLPVPGLAESGFLTNLDLFDLEELPPRLLVVGAGPIGCEMAQAFARFGSEVTVVSLDPRVLPREDPEAAAIVHAALERDGVHLELGAGLERVERRGAEVLVRWQRGGVPGESAGDKLLLAVGRALNTDGLGLEQAGVRTERKRLVLDERLRTTNPRIFAAGDVAGSWQFTHAADAMARLVLRNALFFGRGSVDGLTIPWCTYTSPEVAHVGLYESESEKAGTALESLRLGFKELDRAVLDGDEGFARIIFEKRSGRLRGATVVGEHAGEILGEACLAVSRRMRAHELSSVVHPYPTQASVWARLGDLAMRRRLSPGASAFLETILRWRR